MAGKGRPRRHDPVVNRPQGAGRHQHALGLALDDGTLAGWAFVHERFYARLARRAFLDGATHPAVRGRGIGTLLLRWAIDRGEEVRSPRGRRTCRASWRPSRDASLDGFGRAPPRPRVWRRSATSLDMRRGPAAALPAEPDVPGTRIVPYDAAFAELVRDATTAAPADHWSSRPVRAEDWERDFVGELHLRADLSFVPLADDEVAGYSANYCSEADWAVSDVREAWISQLGFGGPGEAAARRPPSWSAAWRRSARPGWRQPRSASTRRTRPSAVGDIPRTARLRGQSAVRAHVPSGRRD